MCFITSFVEYNLFSDSLVTFNCISLIPNLTINADRKIEMDTHLKVALYPRPSASRPPINGPSNDPETPAVCNVPSILPAVSLGVCVEIRACDIGIRSEERRVGKECGAR